ncbi:MAG TPA: aldo/keto reductase [Candidatus Sulfotelmatobacter sp.]|nr:aldo/keto reductase [Candidatus Sulfotelmatobacter sp.]
MDLYQLHWPDRTTNYFGRREYIHDPHDESVPIEETLAALQELIDEGKIRYVGVSNETAWGIMEYVRLHKEKQLPKIQSIQNPYSLLMREFETALAEIVIKEKISHLVYSPLSFGVLTGKYLGGKLPKGSRFEYEKVRNVGRYNPPHAQQVIQKYVNLAKKYRFDPAQMALAFVISREFVTSTIIGATSLEQLKTDIGSTEVALTNEIVKEIESIHKQFPNPLT